MNDVLVSIKPQYVGLILDGKKSVEIRTRAVKLAPDARLWIYSTLPRGCLEAVARVRTIEYDAPAIIWKNHRGKLGISHKAFWDYVNGSTEISAIFLKEVCRVVPSLTLRDLRSKVQGFNPPQFLKRIEAASPFFKLLKTRRIQLCESSSFEITTYKGKGTVELVDNLTPIATQRCAPPNK